MEYINQDDIYLFNTGNAQRAYLTFGCHYLPEIDSYRFCVWAPNAVGVSLVGDFNNWDGTADPMKKIDGGVYVTFVKGLKDGDIYKYLIQGYDGEKHYKADPFAFYAQKRPETASAVWELKGYPWHDGEYQKKQSAKNVYESPMSVYEVHMGSWKRKEDNSFYSYRETADALAKYVKKMGFTHIEVMPVMEYPFDGSWGYQVTGYYAITSRYGTPQDFMYFVDKMHQNGIGVILDWVPGHFAKDEHGLRRFDGTALYEHENPLQGEHPQWGTMLFNYGRPEVQSFLISNAMYFIDLFHVDGLRLDAVSSMIYLDFGREKDQYVKNKYGGNENLEAIDFMKKLNCTVLTSYPKALMIAEESTAYPLVTKPPYDGGLGFNFKWNMGFMNDMIDYMETDPDGRKNKHNKITFSMQYAFSENYILPFSHDEVVHGKRSMIDKMFGDYWEKFASLRAFYGYLYAHPGKKLLFMGNEFGQFIEWDYSKELDWFLLEYPSHHAMSHYVETLNRFYRQHQSFYEVDGSWDGFQWLNVDDWQHRVVAFLRSSRKKRGKKQEKIVCVTNFTPNLWEDYQVAMPETGTLVPLLNSDDQEFGGSGVADSEEIRVRKTPCLGMDASAKITLPPLATLFFAFEANKTEAEEAPKK